MDISFNKEELEILRAALRSACNRLYSNKTVKDEEIPGRLKA